MTILFFTRLFFPHIGGVEKHVLEISKRLIKKGHNVIIITENHGWKTEEIHDRIQIYRIAGGKEDKNKKLRIWNALWKYKEVILQADVVHCHDVFFWYLPFRYLYSKKPVYTTFHGYEGNRIPGKKAFLMHKLSEKLSFGTICVGDFLKKWYKTNPNFVIYGAIDKRLLHNELLPTKECLFIGRLVEETGIMEYLKALLILKNKKIFLSLDVYGDGDLMEKAKSFVKQHNLLVTFYGFDDKVDTYITKYRYVFTSRYLGILEALAQKRVVFAEYNNAIKKDYLEMAPFADFISLSKDSHEIATSLESVINKKNVYPIEKGYQWAKKQTWEDVVALYETLWQSSRS